MKKLSIVLLILAISAILFYSQKSGGNEQKSWGSLAKPAITVVVLVGALCLMKIAERKRKPTVFGERALFNPDIADLNRYSAQYGTRIIPFYLMLGDKDYIRRCEASLENSAVQFRFASIGEQDKSPWYGWKNRFAKTEEEYFLNLNKF